MDPLGFGLENYDAIGRWRTQDGKFPVDASGAFPNGKTFNGPAEMKALLEGQHARVHPVPGRKDADLRAGQRRRAVTTGCTVQDLVQQTAADDTGSRR